jgi:hypothetical protein
MPRPATGALSCRWWFDRDGPLRAGRGQCGGLAVTAAYPDGVKYQQEARLLWQTSVPPSGQAATMQGELLRAVEKLRDEAHRNGNLNWGSGQETFIAYLRENLIGSALFDQTAAREIVADLDRLGKFEYPQTSKAPYDRLTDRR